MLPYREMEGAEGLDLKNEVGLLVPVPLREMFRREWDSDAHFVCYVPTNIEDAAERGWPRINKAALPALKRRGVQLESTMVVLDWDTPGHVPWTEDLLHDYADKLAGLAGSQDLAARALLDFSLFYTTAAGARLVYVLSEPVPVEQAEDLIRGLVKVARDNGILVDELADWTHVFRLPRVLRDDEQTSEADTFEYIEQLDRRLDVETIPRIAGRGGYEHLMEIEAIDQDKPDPFEARNLLEEVTEKGRRRKTTWFRDAKRRLKGRACYSCLFENASIAAPGRRDVTIQRYIGEAVTLLHGARGSSPELVFALFAEALLALEPDRQTPDWTSVGWAAVLKYWARENAKRKAEQKVEEQKTRDRQSVMVDLLTKVRRWCNHPRIHLNDGTAVDFLSGNLIVSTKAAYHIMTPDGVYDTLSVTSQQISARIRELGMEHLIPRELPRADGKGMRRRLPQEYIDDHSTKVGDVEGAVGPPGGWVRNLGAANATLVLNLYNRRIDLEPLFDNEVDEWLRALGGEHYEKLCRWIAYALAFEEGPICALSIVGPPGCGKKLLVQGLAECVTSECYADAREFGRFQSLMMKTPFIVIDEGFPTFAAGARDPADTFRILVQGGAFPVEQKFRDAITLHNPARVIFSANNQGVVEVLTKNRDLTPEDRDSLAQRLFHFEASNKATRFFRLLGGQRYTGVPGRRWIRGDDGSKSDYVVARHFLWLWANRSRYERDARFLVEGELNAGLVRLMSTRSGSAPEVIETLVSMIEDETRVEGVVVDNAKIFVTESGVVNYFREGIGKKTSRRLNHNQVRSVFRGLVRRGSESHPRVMQIDNTEQRARWYEIDAPTLLEEAVEHGYRCRMLEDIVRFQTTET